jgi:hypothetical protein
MTLTELDIAIAKAVGLPQSLIVAVQHGHARAHDRNMGS